MEANNVITIAEFNRWQKHRLKEHEVEIKQLKGQIDQLTYAIEQFQLNSKKVHEMAMKHNTDTKKLVQRLGWALETLEDLLPQPEHATEEIKQIHDAIDSLRKVYGIRV
jgi:chromosome segregation ATPase